MAEKANQIKQQGGVQTLDKMINDLPTALTRNKEILDEVNPSETRRDESSRAGL